MADLGRAQRGGADLCHLHLPHLQPPQDRLLRQRLRLRGQQDAEAFDEAALRLSSLRQGKRRALVLLPTFLQARARSALDCGGLTPHSRELRRFAPCSSVLISDGAPKHLKGALSQMWVKARTWRRFRSCRFALATPALQA